MPWHRDCGRPLQEVARRCCLLLGALWLLQASPLAAEIYQWRDEHGRLHYSDKKPAQRPVTEVSDKLERTNIDESSDERKKLGDLFRPATEAEKKLLRQQAEEQQRLQQERERHCAAARRQLAVLQGRVYFSREDGSTYEISEAERQQKADAMAAWLQQECGGVAGDG